MSSIPCDWPSLDIVTVIQASVRPIAVQEGMKPGFSSAAKKVRIESCGGLVRYSTQLASTEQDGLIQNSFALSVLKLR